MNNKDIDSLIASCIVQMEHEDCSKRCIEEHRRRWRTGLKPFMLSRGDVVFSHEVGVAFLAEVSSKLTPNKQRGHKSSIRLLESYMLTGIIRGRKGQFCPDKFPLEGEIGTAAQAHLDELRRKRRRESTLANYRRDLHVFIHWLSSQGVCHISEITEDTVVNFIKQLTPAKINVVYTVGQFCSVLHKNKLLSTDLSYVFASNRFQRREKLPSIYDVSEVAVIEKSINQASPTGKRDYAMTLLASRLGLRISDIVNLKWDNIDWDNNTITLNQVKTDNPVSLPLLREVGEAIVAYARDGRPKSKHKEIFLSAKSPYRPLETNSLSSIVSRIIRQSGVNINGRHAGPHSLRHSLANNMLKDGASLTTISSVLGHQTTKTTMEYLRIDTLHLLDCVLDVPLVDEMFFIQKGGIFYD